MSYGYGSLRGIIGVWLVVISAVLLMGSTSVASAESPASGSTNSSVVVTVAITPVRIIVVDDHDRIIEIHSNAPGYVTPSVHRGSSEGETVTMTPSITDQYTSIMHRTDLQRTGIVYRPEDEAVKKPSRLFRPTVISILVGELRIVL